MFEDSLLESVHRIKTKRGKTTTVAFIFEALVIAALEELLPHVRAPVLVAPPPPPPPPPPPAEAAPRVVHEVQSEIVNGQLRTPTKIPEKVKIIKEEESPPPSVASMGGVVGGVPGGVPGGQMGGVIGGIVGSPVNMPKAAPPKKVTISGGVAQGNLTHRVDPTYPPIAKMGRVQGDVILQARISKQGTIEDLRVISGNPMLTGPALEAVKQWKYKPYLLSGEPVEVDTTITVHFTLTGG